MGAAYAREAMRRLDADDRVLLYKIGMVHPIPEAPLLEVIRGCGRVLVVEDGGPLVESQLRTLIQAKGERVEVSGQMHDGTSGRHGELNTGIVQEMVARFLAVPVLSDGERAGTKEEVARDVIPRSSTLCAGCPHLGTYWALRRAMASGGRKAKQVPIANGDIGCYEQAGYGVKGHTVIGGLGGDAPSAGYGAEVLYEFLDTLYVMGSGVSMAQGQTRAGYRDGPVVAVAGDSTFFHSCMPGLLNAVWNGTKLTFVVMDNRWTAMTGHQVCPATGMDARGQPAKTILVEDVARALGVESVEVVDPYDLLETERAIRRALVFEGPAVVVARRECLLQVQRRDRDATASAEVTDDCSGCGLCIELGCPAIQYQDDRDEPDGGAGAVPSRAGQHSAASIDRLLCTGCGICPQVCPREAIVLAAG
jgi:indolepyruvate ferredoxin oxidoreductase alpha subunit